MDPLPTRRALLPCALLLVGIAASCGSACVSSAIYNSAQDAIRAAAARKRLAEYLAPALPPSAATSGGAKERVQVATSHIDYVLYEVTATGDFDEAAIERFLARARSYYPDDTFSATPNLRVTFFRDDLTPPRQLAAREVNVVKEMTARLRALLPPLSPPERAEKIEIRVNHYRGGGRVQVSVTLFGPITADEAGRILEAFRPFVLERRATARVSVNLFRNEGQNRRLLSYDSDKDP
jgi:hypothetical protein